MQTGQTGAARQSLPGLGTPARCIQITAYDRIGDPVAEQTYRLADWLRGRVALADDPRERARLGAVRIIAEQYDAAGALAVRYTMLYDVDGALAEAFERRMTPVSTAADERAALAQRLRWIASRAG